MFTANILLNTIEKVKTFSKLIEKADCDVDLHSERYIIDAKSIMGIFSLDLSKPIKLVAHTYDNEVIEKVLSLIKEYIV